MIKRLSKLSDRVSARGPLAGLLVAVCGSILIGSVPVTLALTVELGIFAPLAMLIGLPTVAVVLTIGAIIVGLPYALLLRALKWEGPWLYSMGGLVLGSFMLLGGAPSIMDFIVKAAGGIYGGICGLLWWYLYRRPIIANRPSPI